MIIGLAMYLWVSCNNVQPVYADHLQYYINGPRAVLNVAHSFTGGNMSRPIFGEVCPDTVPLTCIAHFRLEWPEYIFWVVCSTPPA